MTALSLPPAYYAIRLSGGGSAVAAAREAANAGAAEGALFWDNRTDRFDSALLLRPDRPHRETLPVIFVAALAFADALGSFAPPQVPIALGWPGDILIDGAAAGHIALDWAPGSDDAVPDWAVLHFDLTVAAAAGEPGHAAGVTSVADEGFEEFSAATQLERFSRHFLVWLNRWEAEGFAPIAAEWWRRALGPAARLEVRLPGGGRAAARGLDDFGNLVVGEDGDERILSLAAALAPQARDG